MTRHAGTGFSNHEIGKDPETAETNETEFIFETREFSPEKPPTQVEVKLGLTINLGNFESARVDVGIRIPCTAEEIRPVFDEAKAWCTKQIGGEVKKIRGRG